VFGMVQILLRLRDDSIDSAEAKHGSFLSGDRQSSLLLD
jgi:hypothetical protein